MEELLRPLEAGWAAERDGAAAAADGMAVPARGGRFWDKAMGGAAAVLASAEGGRFAPGEILERLRSGADVAAYRDLDASLLAGRMRDCAAQGRLFRVLPDGTFALRGASGKGKKLGPAAA